MKKSIFLIGLSTATIFANAQTKWYVDSTKTGNGSSWANASNDLQAVINASSAGDTIFVAKGTYEPIRRADDLNTTNGGDCNNAFVLQPDRHIYGVFAGNETNVSQQNWRINETILKN